MEKEQTNIDSIPV